MKDRSEDAKGSGDKQEADEEKCPDQTMNESTSQETDVASKEENEERGQDRSQTEKERGEWDVKKQSNAPSRSPGTVLREEDRYEIPPEKRMFCKTDAHALPLSMQRQEGPAPEGENQNESCGEGKRLGKGRFRVAPGDDVQVRFISAKHSKKQDLASRLSQPSTSTTSSGAGSRGTGSSRMTTQTEPWFERTVLTMDQADLRLPGSYRCDEGGAQRLPPSKARLASNAHWPVDSGYEDDLEEEIELSDVSGGGGGAGGDPPGGQFVTLTEGVLVDDVGVAVDVKIDTSRRRKIIRLGVLLLVIVVVVTVSVAVGVTMSSRQQDTSTPAPTSAPTYEPEPISNEKVVQFLQDPRLSEATVSAMSVNGTPQFKAFQWLNSTTHPDIPDDSDPVRRMVQQFALATLFYATNATGEGDATGWSNAAGWLVEADECEWFGCNCTQTLNETWVLNKLELVRNGLTASALPIEVGLLDGLTTLDLSGNAIPGSIPSELGRLTSLQFLGLSNNTFTGSIPTEIYRLTDLTKLNLDTNQLNGTISSNVGQLSKLTDLLIWTNEGLTGSLPTELGLLTGLTQLYMLSSRFSGPRLSGPIPTEIGNMSQLTNLILSGYLFSGTIPTQLSKLTLVDWLYLQRNELRGSIPTELGRLTKLGELDVSENTALTGSVPESLCGMIRSNSLVVKVSCDVVNCSDACGCTCV
jgi:hypothetical protein